MKSRDGKSQREEKSRREKSRREKMQAREKVGKSRRHCVFPMICGSGGSKSRLAKAAGAKPSGQMRDEKLHAVVARSTFPSQNVQNTPHARTTFGIEMSKKCTPLCREARFEVKICKTHHVRTTDVEKVHAVVV